MFILKQCQQQLLKISLYSSLPFRITLSSHVFPASFQKHTTLLSPPSGLALWGRCVPLVPPELLQLSSFSYYLERLIYQPEFSPFDFKVELVSGDTKQEIREKMETEFFLTVFFSVTCCWLTCFLRENLCQFLWVVPFGLVRFPREDSTNLFLTIHISLATIYIKEEGLRVSTFRKQTLI